MHYTWRSWLEELCKEMDVEKECAILRQKKNNARLEIVHLEYEVYKLYCLYSDVKLALGRAKLAYQRADYELALKDGRLTYIDEIRLDMINEKRMKDITKNLSPSDKKRLLEELEAMEKEAEDE